MVRAKCSYTHGKAFIKVLVFLFRKQLKETQICINLSPGLCTTQMAVGLEEKFKMKAHTAESGAQKIYETIFLPDLSYDVFYHRARKTDFHSCGVGLPRE